MSSVWHLGLSPFTGTCVCPKYHITVANTPTDKRWGLLRMGAGSYKMQMTETACPDCLKGRMVTGEKHAHQWKEYLHVTSPVEWKTRPSCPGVLVSKCYKNTLVWFNSPLSYCRANQLFPSLGPPVLMLIPRPGQT